MGGGGGRDELVGNREGWGGRGDELVKNWLHWWEI